MPGRQVENLLMSIKKSQAFSAGTSRSILPSNIIAPFLLEQIETASLCDKKSSDKPSLPLKKDGRVRLCHLPRNLEEVSVRYNFPGCVTGGSLPDATGLGRSAALSLT